MLGEVDAERFVSQSVGPNPLNASSQLRLNSKRILSSRSEIIWFERADSRNTFLDFKTTHSPYAFLVEAAWLDYSVTSGFRRSPLSAIRCVIGVDATISREASIQSASGAAKNVPPRTAA